MFSKNYVITYTEEPQDLLWSLCMLLSQVHHTSGGDTELAKVSEDSTDTAKQYGV